MVLISLITLKAGACPELVQSELNGMEDQGKANPELQQHPTA